MAIDCSSPGCSILGIDHYLFTHSTGIGLSGWFPALARMHSASGNILVHNLVNIGMLVELVASSSSFKSSVEI